MHLHTDYMQIDNTFTKSQFRIYALATPLRGEGPVSLPLSDFYWGRATPPPRGDPS